MKASFLEGAALFLRDKAFANICKRGIQIHGAASFVIWFHDGWHAGTHESGRVDWDSIWH